MIFSAASITKPKPSASTVIGQLDFTSIGPSTSFSLKGVSIIGAATSIAGESTCVFDSSGNLWVADSRSNRVLEFKPPFTNGQAASVVIGQPDLNSYQPEQLSASSLYHPEGMAFDHSGNLWITDTAYSRVLEFKAPFTNGQAASVVIGQPNFTAGQLNEGQGNRSSTLMDGSNSIAFDPSGNLWVSDHYNSRVLEFKAPFTNGQAASIVIGQTDFTSFTGTAPNATVDFPMSIAFDPSGNLWVADESRIVEFTPKSGQFTSGQSASNLIGQPSYTSYLVYAGTGAPSASSFDFANSIAFDPSGNLWVADTGDYRVLGFADSASATTPEFPFPAVIGIMSVIGMVAVLGRTKFLPSAKG